MRIHVLSDLHREAASGAHAAARSGRAEASPGVAADVVILAGDVAGGSEGVTWAARQWPETPVVYVAGNHEHYGLRWPRYGPADTPMHRAAIPAHIHLLEREGVTLDGFRILGATLWTDFALRGSPDADRQAALGALADYRFMPGPRGAERLLPWHLVGIHQATMNWLEHELARAEGPAVVVTHHAPAPQSLRPGWKDDPLSPSFGSDLTALIERYQPALWVHGHTHRAADYYVGRTRVISNPRGYAGEATGWNPEWLVELA